MKKGYFIVITSLFLIVLNAQDDNLQLISENACNCLSKVSTALEDDKKLEEIEQCISSASLQFQLEDVFLKTLQVPNDTVNKTESSQIKDTISGTKEADFVIETNKDCGLIEKILLADCPRMRLLLSSKDVKSENSVSDKNRAKKFYDKGQDFFTKGEYEKAIVQYEKAVQKDENYAFAWDMIGYSYRKLNEFEKSIEYYRTSLEIDPNGKMPLGNIPHSYEFLEQYDNAIEAYGNYAKIYPDDPESYYGAGRVYHLMKNYENALDKAFKAYLMYKEMNSPYVNDAQHLIGIIYTELQEEDQVDVFDKMAKKYDIQIEE